MQNFMRKSSENDEDWTLSYFTLLRDLNINGSSKPENNHQISKQKWPNFGITIF